MQNIDLKNVYVLNKKRLLCIKQPIVLMKKNVRFLYITFMFLFDICFYFAAKIILFFEYY